MPPYIRLITKAITLISFLLFGFQIHAQEFAKIFNTNVTNQAVNSLYSVINQAYYIVGYENEGTLVPIITKTDNFGNILWTRKYESGIYFQDISELISPDGKRSNIIVGGTPISQPTSMNVMKLEPLNGTIIWSKSYTTNYSFDYPHMIVADNNIVIGGTTSNGFGFSLLDSNGTSIWANTYKIFNNGGSINGWLAYNSQSGIAYTYKSSTNNGIFCINKDGSFRFALRSSKPYYFRNISSIGDGFVTTAVEDWNDRPDNHIILRFSSNGNLTWAKFLKSTTTSTGSFTPAEHSAVRSGNGDIFYVTRSTFSGRPAYNFINLSSNGNLISAKESLIDSLIINHITNLPDGKIGIMGASTKKSECIQGTNINSLFSVFSANSNLCDLSPFNTLSVTNDNIVMTNITSGNTSVTPISIITTSSSNTSTLVSYNQVNYCNEPKLVSLGPDISGCFTEAVNLNAGTGFKTYQWSTGEATSQISANTSGTFWVKVTDNCNNVSSDTIVITKGTGQNSSKNYAFCQGDSIIVGTKVYKTSGTYIDTLANIFGCDSVVTSNLTVTPTKQFSQSKTICKGQSFQVGSSIYTTSGTFTNTFSTTQGCDSIVTTNLTVTPAKQFSQSKTICKGQSFQVGSSIYTTSGTFTNTFSTAQGCDSIVTTLLTVTPTYYKTINPSICKGNSFNVGSNSYSQSGTYLDTLRSIANCDSIIQTILTVNNPINIAIQPIICKGEVFTVGNQQYTFAGNYIDTLISSLGCDSIIQTSLTVNNIISTALNDSICTGETYFFNGQAINNSGIYLSTFTSNSGCDSIVTLTLSLLPNPKVVASANPYSIFVGGDIQLLTFPDSSVFQYNWSPATGLSNPSISAPIATPETTTIYTVEVTYVNGCISSDTVRINVFDPCNLQIPNAFTPNDDGINDCFKILGFNEFDNFSCMIFDRWGEKVFESNNPNICWDGKYKNENAPMDSYFYIVRFDCNKTARKVKGMVSLLR